MSESVFPNCTNDGFRLAINSFYCASSYSSVVLIILSVCLYVTCMFCDKAKQCTVDILIPHERAIALVFTVRLHVMQRTVLLLKFCPSVHLSVCQTRVLWQNRMKDCRYFHTTGKGSHSSFLTPTMAGGQCPLPSEICAQSHPPPSKNADFDRFPLITS